MRKIIVIGSTRVLGLDRMGTPRVCGLRGLLVAAPWNGPLRYVATVRTGFTDHDRRRLPEVLGGRERSRPVVPCPYRGVWVQPSVLCQVNYLEWTRAGRLRGASFHSLITVS